MYFINSQTEAYLSKLPKRQIVSKFVCPQIVKKFPSFFLLRFLHIVYNLYYSISKELLCLTTKVSCLCKYVSRGHMAIQSNNKSRFGRV